MINEKIQVLTNHASARSSILGLDIVKEETSSFCLGYLLKAVHLLSKYKKLSIESQHLCGNGWGQHLNDIRMTDHWIRTSQAR